MGSVIAQGLSGGWKWSILIVLGALLIALDPFRFSIIANNPNFDPNYGTLPFITQHTSSIRDRHSRLQRAEIIHTPHFLGPESLAFDPQGHGPYTGVADGRIMLWNGPSLLGGWSEFAFTARNWTRACIPNDPKTPNLKLEHLCGRPLGLRFNKETGELYIADAYFGLMVVGAEGGLARSLSSQADGIPFRFTNDLDMDSDGYVYFTDTSSKYARREFVLSAFEWDTTGRLLRYDSRRKVTEVLLRNLVMPNGVSLSKDESFLVVAEGTRASLLRYWLKGPKQGTAEIFAAIPGHPDNVRINSKGEFWVAMHCRRNSFMKFLGPKPWMRKFFARIPIPVPYIYSWMQARKPHAMVARYSPDGELLEVLEDEEGRVVKLVSEAEERDGKLWMGSALLPRIAVLDLTAD